MAKEHSPEPWEVTVAVNDDPQAMAWIGDALNHSIISSYIAGQDCDEGKEVDRLIRDSQSRWAEAYVTAADARRIVACVNACAGIPTEWLETHRATPKYTGVLDAEEIMCFPRLERLDGQGL